MKKGPRNPRSLVESSHRAARRTPWEIIPGLKKHAQSRARTGDAEPPGKFATSRLSDSRGITLVFLNFRPSNLSDPSEKMPHKRFCGVGFLKNLSVRHATRADGRRAQIPPRLLRLRHDRCPDRRNPSHAKKALAMRRLSSWPGSIPTRLKPLPMPSPRSDGRLGRNAYSRNAWTNRRPRCGRPALFVQAQFVFGRNPG